MHEDRVLKNLKYIPVEELNKEDIRYYIIGYIDHKNILHFYTNCVNSVFMLGMLEHLKIASLEVASLSVRHE